MLSYYAECRILYTIMLNVILLSIIMLNVVLLSVIMLNVVLLNVIMLNVILMNVIMLNVIMLNVVMLIVAMLSVATPFKLVDSLFLGDESLGIKSWSRLSGNKYLDRHTVRSLYKEPILRRIFRKLDCFRASDDIFYK